MKRGFDFGTFTGAVKKGLNYVEHPDQALADAEEFAFDEAARGLAGLRDYTGNMFAGAKRGGSWIPSFRSWKSRRLDRPRVRPYGMKGGYTNWRYWYRGNRRKWYPRRRYFRRRYRRFY